MSKILIVDDVPDNVKLLQYDLEDDNFEICIATDGLEALEVAAAELPDVILLDIMMPKMNGIETCKALKKNEALAHIPVIMISAKGQDDDIIAGLDAGALDYISKPIHYPVVSARVRSALRVKDYEDSIRKLNDELEKARDEAVISLRARSSFLANMSHEIRTPIATVIGLADIIAGNDQLAPFDNNQAAKAILRNSKHLLEVINNVLDMSKVESSAFEVETIDCSLFHIMNDVSAIVELKAIEKKIDYHVNYHYPLPGIVQTDPTRLKQAIINFAGNAIKFTHKGSVTIDVQYLTEKEMIEVSVSDTGIGISEEGLSKLFQPFCQADTSITRQYGGTGLGLTISKEIIEKLGGTITVSSQIDIGSTFTLRVPIGEIHEDKWVEANPTLDRLEETKQEQLTINGRVLLVEDEPINSRLISHILQKMGLSVETAADGEEGINLAQSETFDLILMDMQLPKIDGLTATRTLRKGNFQTPIIALTASQSQDDIDKCYEAGCIDYMSKPFQKSDLYTCLRRLINTELTLTEEAIQQAIDQSAFAGDEKFSKLVCEYAIKLRGKIYDVEQALVEKNWHELRSLSHRLSSAGMFGFPTITLVSKLLEEQALKQDELACKELIVRLKSEIAKLNEPECQEHL